MRLLVLAIAMSLAGVAGAADLEAGKKKAAEVCGACHGLEGNKPSDPTQPVLAGQQPGYLLNALKAYKSGERSHPSMRGIAASLTEDDMKKLADHYGAPAK